VSDKELVSTDYEVRPYRSEAEEESAAYRHGRPRTMERIALVDLLDRVLAGGVVVAGEITLSVADVDMVTVSLRALITSVSALSEHGVDVRELAS
jgi:hypothetical protein